LFCQLKNMSLSMNLEIVFEDDALLVINKKPGVVVNISKTSPTNTVQNTLQEMYVFDPNDKSEFGLRCGIVHRLDKDTSGLLVVAKDEATFEGLKAQFIRREVQKEYLALVLGKVEGPTFEVDAPIKRNPRNRFKMAVVRGGRPAVTRFELLKNIVLADNETSLLKCFPETGRTHQIRVHLASLLRPVIGDQIYMTRKQLLLSKEIYERLMLHAWKIRFEHPKLEKEAFFEAPFPEEFKVLYSKPY